MTSKDSTTAEKSPFAAVGSRDKTVAWYKARLENVPEQTRELLKTYSRIPDSEVEAHIHKVVSCPSNSLRFSTLCRLFALLRRTHDMNGKRCTVLIIHNSATRPGKSGRIPALASSGS
jgi:hypothetical protein